MLEVNRPCGRRSFRIVQRLVVTLAIAAGVVGPFSAAPAQAATGDLTCPFAGQVNFTPALTATNTTAKASLRIAVFNCISLNGTHSDLTSATWTASGTVTAAPGLNPCSLLLKFVVTGPVIWSPADEQSTFTGTFNTNPSAGPITIKADVTKGVLAGDTASAALLPIPNVDCLVNGLSGLTAVTGLVFFN